MANRSLFHRDWRVPFGGALIFYLPILMTMEMWWLGFAIDKFRGLALLLLLSYPSLDRSLSLHGLRGHLRF